MVVFGTGFLLFHVAVFSDPFFARSAWLFRGAALAVLGFGAVQAARSLRTGRSGGSLPVVPVAAAVVSRRTADPRSGDPIDGTHFLGLQFEDGSRDEFPAEGPAYTTAADGEIGVALLHRGRVISFRAADEPG